MLHAANVYRQIVCCLNSTRFHYPVNGCNPAVVEQVYVQNSAFAEFPKSSLSVLVVQNSASVVATNSSAMLTVSSKIVLRNGLIGCLGCSTSSLDVLRNSCDEICPNWKIVCDGHIVMDGYSKMIGNNISILVQQNMFILQGAMLYPSSWNIFSSIEIDCSSLVLNGTIHFSIIQLNVTNISILEAGLISADGSGAMAGTGLGDGLSNRLGGGGGGHGGRGAQACYLNMTGGSAYDQLIPSDFGSAGGYGNLNLTSGELEEEVKLSRDGSWNLATLSSVGFFVRQVHRTRESASLTSGFCQLRGMRLFPSMLPQYVTPAEKLPRFKTDCPVGMRGSSMRDWCCSGLNCDCILVRNNSVPGGRGGGIIKLFASKQVQLNGSISANGESYVCNRGYPTFSTGGGGAGGSISIGAQQFLGAGNIRSSGGSVQVACSSTISGGGGAGGRIFLRNHDRDVIDPISLEFNISAFGGSSDGCGAGGAGTIFIEFNQTLIVDNGFASFWSAITPFPYQDSSHANLTDIIVRRRASLLSPGAGAFSSALSVWVRDKGFLAAGERSASLQVKTLIVLNKGLVGCLMCWSSTDSMNNLPGCSDKQTLCPAMR